MATDPSSVTPSQSTIDQLKSLIQALSAQGGLPVAFSVPRPRVDTAAKLNKFPPLTVAFPTCASELLALIKIDRDQNGNPIEKQDEITDFFREYFVFQQHRTLGLEGELPNPKDLNPDLRSELDKDLLDCEAGDSTKGVQDQSKVVHRLEYWPSECCICSPFVTLFGNRNPPPPDPNGKPISPALRRLFVGDVLWLHFWERMGLHQMLGAVLDSFAYSGRLPISNGAIGTGVRDDIVALVLEVMVRQVKTGLSSSVRDRASVYRTVLGWNSESGKKLEGLDTAVNTGFNSQFHKFIFHALEFFKDKRLAVAIQGHAGGVARPSAATLVTISETLELLKKRFEPLHYGRNYYNTLAGIVWTIAGLSVIRELAPTLGIPPAFRAPDEYVPAAYDILVAKRSVTHGEANRYILHRECARNGRDVLLDIGVVNHLNAVPGGDLEDWLNQVEAKVEAYRTSYRTLTGADLAQSAVQIEQQA